MAVDDQFSDELKPLIVVTWSGEITLGSRH